MSWHDGRLRRERDGSRKRSVHVQYMHVYTCIYVPRKCWYHRAVFLSSLRAQGPGLVNVLLTFALLSERFNFSHPSLELLITQHLHAEPRA